MGTKNNPGSFDCYLAADPDEPMFVLLGRDPIGGALVRLWAASRPALNKPGDAAKIAEATACAAAMDAWCVKVGREPRELGGARVERVPTGWKLVPIEPTTAMLMAGKLTDTVKERYQAQLAAVLNPPVPGGTSSLGGCDAASPASNVLVQDALKEMEERKDAAYEERNRVVAALAWMAVWAGWKAGLARTAIEGWSEDWHGCLYIDFPNGQASWHYHDSHAHLFNGLPPYKGSWDGHTTPEKYERLAHVCEVLAEGGPRGEVPVVPRTAEAALEREGVFKGMHGLRGLANASDFWERQMYGTRLYYGPGGLDYLHRSVLTAAVAALDRGAEPKRLIPRKGIYVASRVRHAAMWQECRTKGVPVISSWIEEAGDGDTDDFTELWGRIQREITSAERLVFFAQKGDDPWKGAFIEIGIACAAGVPVFVVLDPEIELDGRTCRPLGSWLHHPNVVMAPTLHDAFTGSEHCYRFQGYVPEHAPKVLHPDGNPETPKSPCSCPEGQCLWPCKDAEFCRVGRIPK